MHQGWLVGRQMGSQAHDLIEARFEEAGQVRRFRNRRRDRAAQTSKQVRHLEIPHPGSTRLQRAVMEFEQGPRGDPEMLGHPGGAKALD